MSTITARILDRLDQLLKANVPLGTQVFRDRADAVTRQETPCINVVARSDAIESFSAETDKHELLVELRINVRDAVPTPLAEAQLEGVHGPIVTDSELKSLCESVRLVNAAFEPEEADQTSLIKTAQYRFTYLIPQVNL